MGVLDNNYIEESEKDIRIHQLEVENAHLKREITEYEYYLKDRSCDGKTPLEQMQYIAIALHGNDGVPWTVDSNRLAFFYYIASAYHTLYPVCYWPWNGWRRKFLRFLLKY